MAPLVTTGDLVDAINDALPVPLKSHTATTAPFDLYEAFLFAACVEAAESVGMSVTFRDAFDNPVSSLLFRTSPSHIWSNAQAFTHACLAKDGDVRLEVHIGIFVKAASGVSHEADVVVLDTDEAARARVQRADPRANHAVALIEAKFYGSNLPLSIGREFLGLSTDFGGGSTVFVASAPGPSVERLLSHRHRAGHFELVPGAEQENELKGQIAMKIRSYLALHP